MLYRDLKLTELTYLPHSPKPPAALCSTSRPSRAGRLFLVSWTGEFNKEYIRLAYPTVCLDLQIGRILPPQRITFPGPSLVAYALGGGVSWPG